MPNDLLARAREQAERSSPPVRAAARLRIARVESATNPVQSRSTLQSALDEIPNLTGRERQDLFDLAQQIAAAVAPDLIPTIPSGHGAHRDFFRDQFIKIMLDHGHHDAAYRYVIHYDDPGSFPFLFLGNLMQALDGDRRLAVFRSAITAWQTEPSEEQILRRGYMPLGRRDSHFTRLFGFHWKLLPPNEALAVVNGIVRDARKLPDQGISARFPDGIHFTSAREHELFNILHILRHLDPALAESLVAEHPQLAAAAQRYPNGLETMHKEAEARTEELRKLKAASGEACEGGFIMTGSGGNREMEYQHALIQASRDGNFAPTIDYVLECYRESANPSSPNYAPKTFRSSVCAFRTILYRAGKKLGIEAVSLLDRAPDDDHRLFAQIELAAALAGLPEWGETTMRQPNPPGAEPRNARLMPSLPRGGAPMKTPDGRGVRCPKCQWLPPEGTHWVCKCRHTWNTFWTGGKCPSCRHQWEITACHNCGQISTHTDWYLPA